MKLLKLLALMALPMVFSACGDDDDPAPFALPTEGTVVFSGQLTTTASGVPYSTDATSARLVWTGEDTARLVIAQMTARPGTDTTPASVMTDFTVEQLSVKAKGDGVYTLSSEEFAGGGTMGGKYSPFVQGSASGTIKGRTLSIVVDYKFTPSPSVPNLSSEFVGTVK